MNNLKTEIEKRLVEKEGYFEAIINFNEVMDRESFEDEVSQLGYQIWFDLNDGEFYRITKED